LAEFCLSLPENYKISPSGYSKQILRNAMTGRIPDTIRNRTDKIGYAPPEKKWLAGNQSSISSILSSAACERIPFYDSQKAGNWYKRIQQTGKFERRLWFLINTILWAEKFDVTFPENEIFSN
jgi:asparagine synthase (glutamine-hydrolysing)